MQLKKGMYFRMLDEGWLNDKYYSSNDIFYCNGGLEEYHEFNVVDYRECHRITKLKSNESHSLLKEYTKWMSVSPVRISRTENP